MVTWPSHGFSNRLYARFQSLLPLYYLWYQLESHLTRTILSGELKLRGKQKGCSFERWYQVFSFYYFFSSLLRYGSLTVESTLIFVHFWEGVGAVQSFSQNLLLDEYPKKYLPNQWTSFCYRERAVPPRIFEIIGLFQRGFFSLNGGQQPQHMNDED